MTAVLVVTLRCPAHVPDSAALTLLMTELAADGLGVLFISEDTEEILGLAHRVLVMRGGQIKAELTGDAMTEAAVLAAAFGAPELGSGRGA